MSRLAVLLSVIVMLSALVFAVQAQDDMAYDVLTLEARAVLPADTFAEGPASGAALEPTNGRTPPFESQPVQGISAILPAENGNYYVMSDNGFGAKANSADYHLRFYEVSVNFDAGTVEVIGFTQLSDPDKQIPFPIQNEATDERILTGADFDIESFRQTADGTFWFGDEFGPFLLHIDANGHVLEAPIATPYPADFADFARGLDFVQSPENPAFVDLADQDARIAAANLPTSRGFEGMALNTSGTTLYPLLEGALFDDPTQTNRILQEFDLETKTYTGSYWIYPMARPDHAIGEMTAINDNELLVIERDNNQGYDAAFKRIYRIDLTDVGEDGHTLTKTLVADLMGIYDANGLTSPEAGVLGFGSVFKFPFQTIEAVYPLDANTLIVTNDNNFPFSMGRRPGLAPDDNEFMLIGLPEMLNLAE